MFKSFLIKKFFSVKSDEARQRSLRWVRKGEVLKIVFDASLMNEVVKLREQLWKDGVVVQLICVTRRNELYADVLNISENLFIYTQIKHFRILSGDLLKGGVLLSLYEKNFYVVNHLVAVDDALIKLGVNITNPELFDFSFTLLPKESLCHTVNILKETLKKVEI